jgi:flagellar protein FlaF
MKKAQDDDDVEAMITAVRLNWRLWTIFQADLLDPECPLPEDIRNNVLTLANFVDHHTVAFLGSPRKSMLDTLININRQLSAGLYAEPADAVPEPEPTIEMAQPLRGLSV